MRAISVTLVVIATARKDNACQAFFRQIICFAAYFAKIFLIFLGFSNKRQYLCNAIKKQSNKQLKTKDIMLTENLKAKEKEELYEVVEPRYFEKAESLSSEDEQGSVPNITSPT